MQHTFVNIHIIIGHMVTLETKPTGSLMFVWMGIHMKDEWMRMDGWIDGHTFVENGYTEVIGHGWADGYMQVIE